MNDVQEAGSVYRETKAAFAGEHATLAGGAERPLQAIINRLRMMEAMIQERFSEMHGAQMNTLNRMIGEPAVEREAPEQTMKPGQPPLGFHFGGDLSELADAVNSMEISLRTLADRHNYVTNRLTSIG